MPGKKHGRAVALALFLSIGMLPHSNATQPSRTVVPHTAVQHMRARAYLPDRNGNQYKRARAMRYTGMAVLRAKCELSKKDKRQCARLMAGATPKPPVPPAPASPHPAPATTSPDSHLPVRTGAQ